ncbi:hypothetical protein L1987_77302 [Smallanthus sonchifolius]|uniref:Uncharacterized protein n=1 Tax=Smallanthus sonchifolius TaxID=185202 RepID=A0ACB8ZAH0_9ASTR|nr:hypothetical protein L1987_77302 [Smallanthus sonchifolius]
MWEKENTKALKQQGRLEEEHKASQDARAKLGIGLAIACPVARAVAETRILVLVANLFHRKEHASAISNGKPVPDLSKSYDNRSLKLLMNRFYTDGQRLLIEVRVLLLLGC